MTHHFTVAMRLLLGAALLLTIAGCASRDPQLPPDPALADRFLFDRGTAALKDRKWLDAREYFRQVVENYPQSSLRAEAKLGIGDAYLGEDTTQSLILAANEYREFLTFYPRNERADYAQYKLAMTFFEQMHGADRDQTPTREALAEFAVFFDRHPKSPLLPEARTNWRIARDRLSASSYDVGLTYFRRSWCPGAVSRFREVLREDPEFSRIDGVYYHLAECLVRADNKAEAIPLYDRVIREYKASEHLDDAQRRLKELQAQ